MSYSFNHNPLHQLCFRRKNITENKRSISTDRTTNLLIVILISFLVSELPMVRLIWCYWKDIDIFHRKGSVKRNHLSKNMMDLVENKNPIWWQPIINMVLTIVIYSGSSWDAFSDIRKAFFHVLLCSSKYHNHV